MEEWLSASLTTSVPLPASRGMKAELVAKPMPQVIAASLPCGRHQGGVAPGWQWVAMGGKWHGGAAGRCALRCALLSRELGTKRALLRRCPGQPACQRAFVGSSQGRQTRAGTQ